MTAWQNPDPPTFNPNPAGGGFNSTGFTSNLGGFLGGLFGDSGKPYSDYETEYKKWMDQQVNQQQPYANAGKEGLNNYQDWLTGQKDPAKWINDQMGKYNESDYAHNLQQQSVNAGQNAASASGLTGSTPLMQQLQQNAGAITSADQNQWLNHVKNINKQYGEGQNNLVQTGKNAANSLTDIYGNAGTNLGEAEYNKTSGKNKDFWNAIGGGLGLVGNFFGLPT